MVRMMKVMLVVILLVLVTVSADAQSVTDLIAPNIFVRGIQLPQGVRYTASFIKPIENAALKNISVEITLPAEAQFTEMLVSRQVQFHVVRKNRQRQLTLIWQISRLAEDQALDSFSFTLAQPLTGELEFYMQWQTAEGEQRVEDFFEVPSVVVATQAQAQARINQPGFVTLSDTGVQVSAPVGANLSAQVLPVNFNPPAEYGNIWWCSLLKLEGLPPDTVAEVIVPLRRSLASFTALQLFQQQADGSWIALAGQGVVTADGQYVIYTHPGGVMATGGDAEIQPEAVPASEVPVVDESAPSADVNQPPADSSAPPADNNSQTAPSQDDATDGQPENSVEQEVQPLADNTNPVVVQPTVIPPAQDGGDNTGAAAQAGDSTVTVVRPTLQAPVVTPIIIGAAPTNIPPTLNTITDGTSNTIIIGEVTSTPKPDGSVPLLPTATRTSGIADGSSNTIIIGEVTSTPKPDGSVPLLPTATRASGIADGSSNTIIIGEVTSTPKPDGSVPLLPTATRASGIADGTSNTIIIGEATRTPTLLVLVTAKPTQKTDGVVSVLPTNAATPVPTRVSGITDGSSNTIIVGERTATPVPTTRPTATPISVIATPTPPPVFSPVTAVTTQPFGAGVARVVILKTSSSSTVLQCQAGQVNCSLLNRRLGTGLR